MGASAGRVLLIPKGDWNADTTYTGLDWVRHNGAAWVCKNTCTNVEPNEENSDNWQIIARDGQSGSIINVDAAMSDTSENPVQNKVIKKYVDDHTPEVADMTGATATQNGAHGLVPAPQIGDEKKALLGDGTWGSVDAILTFKTKEEYDAAVANDEIPDGAKVIKEYDEGDSTAIIDVDTVMSDTSENPVQNKVIKKYVDDKQVNIDGVTLTLDEARNVIKLADALKNKIGSALQPESIANNQITTVEGFALDARQANPNIDGTLAKQISNLNGSLNTYEIKTLTIVDSNFATGNRCGCAMIQKRWISLNGEIDVDFTNVKNYTGYTALKSPVLPLFNTTFTAIDEDGMGYTGIFYADGRVDIAIRSYIPESKKQILRFSCIAFASI